MKNKIFYLFLTLTLTTSNCAPNRNVLANENEITQILTQVRGNKFYYFGYGSNMLEKRIHIQNPTATKIGGAKLENWKLDFFGFSTRWNGAPATIVPKGNATTYGTLWAIDLTNLKDLDDQEGVPTNLYAPVDVHVSLNENGMVVKARAYHLVEQPTSDLSFVEDDSVPYDRQPSKTYLKCLVKGAIETGLPADYIKTLRSFKHNNCISKKLEDILELKDVLL